MPLSPDSLLHVLGRGVATSSELQREFEVSQPTLSRALSDLGDRIVRIGKARSTRYGLRRELPQIGSSWPIFSVSTTGSPTLLGRLNALARDQYWFDAVSTEHSGVSDGLPYFLQDLWPQGFIGRTVPRRFPELGLPERITDWNDAHVLTYLCRRGEDCIGDLIVGDESLQRFLRQFHPARSLLNPNQREREYPKLAAAAIAGTAPGSSAGGEHPKFTTSLRSGRRIRHVLVKFSPGGADAGARRWADLLVCEHLAIQALRRAELTSASTELLDIDGRIFLEADRFDRTGVRGRVGIVSLAPVADHYLGRRDNWISAAVSLARTGEISAGDEQVIRRVATFGRLIGNTDMHFGNLSFFFSLGAPLSLAPVYDMLPMLYAPLAGDQLPDRTFEAPLPSADTLHIWGEIADLAARYWNDVASHELVSEEFSEMARANAALVTEAKALAS
ncbi:MAG TPA: type II toxin-antitoxin system HipA family toxin YjjJ [Steroidobacteraceae bacterium]|nr:type II toxin-antitoxin system HipA family toxin YjjJ [Steroidobacteraceae bacterium]